MSECHPSSTETLPPTFDNTKRHRLVALIGPPNTGKSTLFNSLTGLRQRVANYPGVTVERHVGLAKLDNAGSVTLVDLPGIYSLDPRSEDEVVTRDVLDGRMSDMGAPDGILLILDSTNLERHLMLAAPVLSLGIPTLVILNMTDDLKGRGGSVDLEKLSEELGAPVLATSARSGTGVEEVRTALAKMLPKPKPVQLPILNNMPECRQWGGARAGKSDYRKPLPPEWTYRLDSFLLHPVWGAVAFLVVVVAVFQSIFTLAEPLKKVVEWAVQASGQWIEAALPASAFRQLLIEGVWGGVGGIVVFLPQILILFAFLAFLEDSGYLARAALIADRTMAKVGLQGKSFIPLLSGYACAIPAILSTRTIENKRDRFATILVTPLMTCSARLPVYTMVIAAFVPDKPVLGPFLTARPLVLLSLYALGFLAAVTTARLLKSTIFRSEHNPFVLELPPYRWPRWQTILYRLLDRAKVFLKRASTVILATSVLLWILAHLPMTDGKAPGIGESYAGKAGKLIEPVIQPLGFNWKIGIGLITSLAAREVIVSTLGSIYGIEDTENTEGLQNSLKQDLTFPGAISLLVFFAFALQCMSTIAVVRRETGNWKWPIAQFTYMGLLAYGSSFLVFRVLTSMGW